MAGITEMPYNRLGSTGLKVSALSYGSWVTFNTQLDTAKAKTLMGQCFDAGVNFFDNAEAYAQGKSEVVMGEAIKELGWKRSDVVLSTKIFWGGSGPNDKGLSRKHIIEGTKAALKRMDQEYVDLVFAHRPDPDTPMEETVRAFNWVIDQGLAFYWGTSEWTSQQITEAWAVAHRLDLIGPAMEQPEYNLFERKKVESEFVPLYQRYGTGTTTWSPLAYGLLSGKYGKDNIPEGSRLGLEQYSGLAKTTLVEEKLSKVDSLKPVAAELGCSLAQLSIAWAASNPNVSTVITGATSSQQVTDNLGALEFIPKIDSVRDKIEDIMQNKPEAVKTYK
jgi:voltage-dependent potassium channel beta subunit